MTERRDRQDQGSVMLLSCNTGHSGNKKLINDGDICEFNVGFPILSRSHDNSIPSTNKRIYRYLPYVVKAISLECLLRVSPR